MPGWPEAVRLRLNEEKKILEQYFKDKVKWIDPTQPTETRVELEIKSSSDNAYKLRLYLKEDFPNSCPDMAIVHPRNIRTRDKRELPLLDSSFHTLGLTVDGFTKLCHFKSDLWTQDNTLYQVFIKGLMWIEAYEGHIQTGNSLDTYLKEQPGANRGEDEEGEQPEGDGKSTPAERSRCCIS